MICRKQPVVVDEQVISQFVQEKLHEWKAGARSMQDMEEALTKDQFLDQQLPSEKYLENTEMAHLDQLDGPDDPILTSQPDNPFCIGVEEDTLENTDVIFDSNNKFYYTTYVMHNIENRSKLCQ